MSLGQRDSSVGEAVIFKLESERAGYILRCHRYSDPVCIISVSDLKRTDLFLETLALLKKLVLLDMPNQCVCSIRESGVNSLSLMGPVVLTVIELNTLNT